MLLPFVAAIVGLAALVGLALAAGYRSRSPRAWRMVALAAAGGIVCGYGLLGRLLCAAGPACGATRSGVAIWGGGGVALVALAILSRDVHRR